jgi:protoporphyrin/coproporphyrin ferrochelatase
VNLGSPDSYQVKDVKKYLREFLMDERVLDAPWLVRKVIVEGLVLPFRPAKSAEAYASVWMKNGAPLKVLTDGFKEELQHLVGLPIAVAMRYGHPTPAAALRAIDSMADDLQEIWIAPLYPHYAMSSYETALLYVRNEIQKIKPGIKLHILQPFYQEEGYIYSLAQSIQPYLSGECDHLRFSYHGGPVRHLKKTDPTGRHCYKIEGCCEHRSPAWQFCYKHQVIQTTKLTAIQLGLTPTQYSYSFQSRLGQDEWIKPFTVERLENFPKESVKKLLVACPAFVADCLETLEEMAIRGEKTFMASGGESFHLIPCLNASGPWVKTFAGYCNEESQYKARWKAEAKS